MSSSAGRKINPKVEKYFFLSAKDEFFALLNFLRHQWYLIALLLSLLGAVAYVASPLPPSKISIASGQENSTLEVIARQYQQQLGREGIAAELVKSKGAIENLELLKQGKVDVAISQGGAALGDARGIASLGSIGYQPLWFFYRGAKPENDDVFQFLQDKRISIGLQGSGTRTVVDSVLPLLSAETQQSLKILELSATDSIKALQANEIDGMFLLAGIESGNAQTLLNTPEIRILNFPVAEAMTRHLDYAEVVTVPRGSIRMSPMHPDQDVHMIATTTNVLIRQNLHPAIQTLLLKAEIDLYRHETAFFDRAGGFPAFVGKSVPRSPVAERYLSTGPLLLDRYMPYWLASFLDQAWVWILGFMAVVYPLVRTLPSYRKTMFDIVASDKYAKMFDMYQTLEHPRTAAEQIELLRHFELLAHEINTLWVPKGCKEAYGNVLRMLAQLRDGVEKSRQQFHSASAN